MIESVIMLLIQILVIVAVCYLVIWRPRVINTERWRHSLDGEASDMIDKSGIIVLRITQETSGLYTAISPQLDGVYLAHRNLDAIFEDMPDIIKLWFKSHRNEDVEVFG